MSRYARLETGSGGIGWESHGRGPNLVLLHGSLVDRSCWDPLVPFLSRAHRVHCVDRRGRGLSAAIACRGDVESEAVDLSMLVASLPPPVTVCAWSFGAVVALEAAMNGAPIARLVLYEPPVPIGGSGVLPALAADCVALLAAGRTDDAVEAFLTRGLGLPQALVRLWRQGPGWSALLAHAATAGRELSGLSRYRYVAERVRRCRLPVLVLSGALSPAHLRDAALGLAADLPDVRLVTLAGHHHFAFQVDPAMFAAQLEGFTAIMPHPARPRSGRPPAARARWTDRSAGSGPRLRA